MLPFLVTPCLVVPCMERIPIKKKKKIKVLHINTLFDLFPEYDFNEEVRGENQQEHDDSLQSSY